MLEINDVHKSYGDVRAVDGITLRIEKGKMLSLLGPSGCGKTTLLRVLSGFLKPSQGTIIMDGQDVTLLPPEKRPTAMVFQNYALFPHMNIFNNISFGLRVRKWPLKKIRKAVKDILALVDLSGIETRSIYQLSGGQQQRIALARALILKPTVLLLDEPLSNLDAKLRVETRSQIRKIQKRVEITSIFVTHDQEEALTISDQIAVMNKGKIIQVGTPEEIYYSPNSNFVSDFIGKSNFLSGIYEPDSKGGGCFVLGDGTKILVANSTAPAGTGKMVIRPEMIRLIDCPEDAPGENIVPGRVEVITFLGEIVYYQVKIETGEMIQVPMYGSAVYNSVGTVAEGESVFLSWKPKSGSVLPL